LKEGTLESRIYGIVESAIEYIDSQEMNIIDAKGYTEFTKDSLRNYFYGPGGMREELAKAKDRIAEGKRPIFLNLHPPSIFSKESLTEMTHEFEVKSSAEASEVEMLVQREISRLLGTPEFDQRVREIVKGN